MARSDQGVSDSVVDQFFHLLNKLRDEGCMLLLQRVPYPGKGIPETTCRHLQCPYENAIFHGGDFILSLENHERCDPSTNSLSYKAIATLSVVLRSPWNHVKGKPGLGERGEERWHVTCFESLCREIRKRELLDHPEDDIPSWAPSMEFGHHIVADERQITAHPGKFNLESPYRFGLQLWKATQLFDDKQAHGAYFLPSISPHIQLPQHLVVGRDGQSLYLNHEARDFRGKMPWDEIAEIPAAEVRGVTLDEMTRRVAAIVRPKYQARRALKGQGKLKKTTGKGANATEHEVLAEREHDANGPMSSTAVLPTPRNGSPIPETTSVTVGDTRKDDVAEDSHRTVDIPATSKQTPKASANDNLSSDH